MFFAPIIVLGVTIVVTISLAVFFKRYESRKPSPTARPRFSPFVEGILLSLRTEGGAWEWKPSAELDGKAYHKVSGLTLYWHLTFSDDNLTQGYVNIVDVPLTWDEQLALGLAVRAHVIGPYEAQQRALATQRVKPMVDHFVGKVARGDGDLSNPS